MSDRAANIPAFYRVNQGERVPILPERLEFPNDDLHAVSRKNSMENVEGRFTRSQPDPQSPPISADQNDPVYLFEPLRQHSNPFGKSPPSSDEIEALIRANPQNFGRVIHPGDRRGMLMAEPTVNAGAETKRPQRTAAPGFYRSDAIRVALENSASPSPRPAPRKTRDSGHVLDGNGMLLEHAIEPVPLSYEPVTKPRNTAPASGHSEVNSSSPLMTRTELGKKWEKAREGPQPGEFLTAEEERSNRAKIIKWLGNLGEPERMLALERNPKPNVEQGQAFDASRLLDKVFKNDSPSQSIEKRQAKRTNRPRPTVLHDKTNTGTMPALQPKTSAEQLERDAFGSPSNKVRRPGREDFLSSSPQLNIEIEPKVRHHTSNTRPQPVVAPQPTYPSNRVQRNYHARVPSPVQAKARQAHEPKVGRDPTPPQRDHEHITSGGWASPMLNQVRCEGGPKIPKADSRMEANSESGRL